MISTNLYLGVYWLEELIQEIKYPLISSSLSFLLFFYSRFWEMNYSFSVCIEREYIYFPLPKESLSSVFSSELWSNFYFSLHFVESITDFSFLSMMLMQSIKIPFHKIFFQKILSFSGLSLSHNHADSYVQGYSKGFLKFCMFTTLLAIPFLCLPYISHFISENLLIPVVAFQIYFSK